MYSFTFWDILVNLLSAARWTVALSLVAFVGGGLLGLGLTLLQLSDNRLVKACCRGYVALFQGTPLLMQLFLVFFGLSIFGIDLSPWSAASIALIAFSAAFLGDIWIGCIRSIPAAQWEAGSALGLTFFQQCRHVILPQALRIATPPTVGFAVQIIKNTSLTSIVGFVELTKSGTALNNVTFEPFLVFSLVAAIYFSLCYPLSWLSRKLEKKLNVAY